MMTRNVLLLVLLAGCKHRYFVNEAAWKVPNVFLHEVRTSGSETTLVLRLEAEEACEIGVPPPGAPDAFKLRSGDKVFALTDISGCEELPGTSSVDARGSRRFSLSFEPLPEDVRAFDVEGEIAGAGPVAFVVHLDAPNVVKCGR